MSDTKTQNTIPIFEQFNALIESNIPDEYKSVLKSFHDQGHFYNQLIQSINKKQDLSTFWDLPNTLGFNTTPANDTDWFRSFFDINGFSATSNSSLTEQFSTALDQFSKQTPNHLKDFQAAWANMAALHGQLSEQAKSRFEALQNVSNTPSEDELCNMWLQAGEETFKKLSQSDEYIKTQQALFGSLSQLRHTQQQLSQQFTTLLGLPSSESLSDVQKGLHQLRMEFAEYKEQTDVKIEQLKRQLNKAK